jgi:hypothetical protein
MNRRDSVRAVPLARAGALIRSHLREHLPVPALGANAGRDSLGAKIRRGTGICIALSQPEGSAMADKIRIEQHSVGGMLWGAGWLFTIGFLHLTFWKGALALMVWPYYLGVFLSSGAGALLKP